MSAIYIPKNIEDHILSAVRFFWNTRDRQISIQQESGVMDTGNRSAVTGGKQMDGFVNLLRDLLIENNVPQECIFTDRDLELPGYYRPNKKWDLLVIDQNELIIAIELKSQTGPSFGNNFNNRTEEAMGSALDFWTAYREGAFGIRRSPWLGYFFVLEDCEKSTVPVRANSPHFEIFPEFVGASYLDRYEIFCSKLLLERKYNAACFLTTGRNKNEIRYGFPNSALSFYEFIISMLGVACAYFDRRE